MHLINSDKVILPPLLINDVPEASAPPANSNASPGELCCVFRLSRGQGQQ